MDGDITDVLTGAEARKRIRAGVNTVYNAVKLTLGPEGQNALLPRSFNRGPRLTNDGVTVSENIKPENEHERLAADFYKEGSKKTNELVGDGTTTTAVIAATLINETFDELDKTVVPTASLDGVKPSSIGMRELRRELLNDKDKVVEAINKSATKVKDLDDLKKIATISIGKEDEETAHKVAETVWNLARGESGEYKDAHIDVTEGYKGEIEIEETYGMRFPAKLAHRAFINKPERFEMEAEDVRVLITNYRLDNPQEIVQTLNNLQVPKVAIFAPHFSLPVIQTLINTTKNGLFCYPVLCPALRTEILEDLATYTGAVIIDKDSGRRLDTATMDNLGFADKITTRDVESKEDAVLMGGKGEKLKRSDGNKVTKRIETLKKQLPETKNEMSRVQLEKRIANLQAAMGVIRVGASTNAELLFLKLKIEDGVYACKAALQEGYVKGGGLCLKEIAEKMSKSKLYKALQEPYAQIQRNAGGLLKIEDDVIDPAKVVRLEVEHAVSVASSMITTGIIVPERRNRTEYEGNMQIAKAVAKSAYYTAKHHNLLQESEDEAEADREKAFEQALFDAEKD